MLLDGRALTREVEGAMQGDIMEMQMKHMHQLSLVRRLFSRWKALKGFALGIQKNKRQILR